MITIHAKGTANVDGVILIDQEITVSGDGNIIKDIVFGDVTFGFDKGRLF